MTFSKNLKTPARLLMTVGFIMLSALLLFSISCQTGDTTLQPTTPTIPGQPVVPQADQTGQAEAKVIIHSYAYTPQTLRISVGTRVTWTNQDLIRHTVTSNDGLFDSGTLTANVEGPGKEATFSYTFTEAGTYKYHCTLQPNIPEEQGEVIVE